MVYELRRQPFRGIYITIQLLQTYLIRMPIWVLLSLPKFLRPRPSWSVFKTFNTNYARVWSDIGPIAARCVCNNSRTSYDVLIRLSS